MSKDNKRTHKDTPDVQEFIAAEAELHALKQQQGIEEKEGKLSSLISGIFKRRDARQKVKVNKKKHLLIALFTGWLGGHRFQAKQYFLGIAYLLLCWTGLSVAMTLIDLLIIIPMPADENGDIWV